MNTTDKLLDITSEAKNAQMGIVEYLSRNFKTTDLRSLQKMFTAS